MFSFVLRVRFRLEPTRTVAIEGIVATLNDAKRDGNRLKFEGKGRSTPLDDGGETNESFFGTWRRRDGEELRRRYLRVMFVFVVVVATACAIVSPIRLTRLHSKKTGG